MIEVHGIEGTREYHAVQSIADASSTLWPDIAATRAEEEAGRITSDAKLSNGAVTDVDVVIAGFFKVGRNVRPRKVLRDRNGGRLTGVAINIENVAIAVEVKDQPAISSVTDAVSEEVKRWQGRPLDRLYPILYLDCVHAKVRDAGAVRTKAVYLAIGVNLDGHKEVLGLGIAQTEGAKFWLQLVTELENRGVQDIFIAWTD